MSTIDDRIAEARALAARFGPVAMNSAVPGREDFHKLSLLVLETFLWIKEHEEQQAEHVRLHRELDELLACYLSENRTAGPRRSVHDEILDLLKWSKQKAA